jgi:hypothetical protein
MEIITILLLSLIAFLLYNWVGSFKKNKLTVGKKNTKKVEEHSEIKNEALEPQKNTQFI